MSREDQTDIYEEPLWYPAVETADELYALAEPGARCMVMSEGVPYLFYDGQWRRLAAPTERRRNREG